MIVYLDTSAFLKLYLDEEDSGTTREIVEACGAVCTHLVTYAEMCASLAQAVRMQRLTDADRSLQKSYFEADWNALHVLLYVSTA